MCGIAGLLFRDGTQRVDTTQLAALAGSMTHRGPDDEGTFVDGSIGLTMRRLAVIDLASGRQPIWNEDRTVAVILNGEIYNHRDLRKELEARDHRFRTGSDAEVIVHLYEDLGASPDLPSRLKGMFAFAVYDAERRRLFIARDRAGKKPLYVYRDAAILAFASEITSLFATALPLDRSLDVESLDSFFATQYVCGPRTIFQRVRQLPPASCLLVERTGATWTEGLEQTYWRIPAADPAGVRDWGSFSRAVDACDRALTHAVQARLMSDVPLGVLLSGGIDSSLITAMAARVTGPGLRTFSIGFQDREYDESEVASRVARYLGTSHRSMTMPAPTADDVTAILSRTDQPLADPAIIPTWYLARFARSEVTVALTGEGADEVFGGYHWYRRNPRPEGDPEGLGAADALYARREQAPAELRLGLIAPALRTGANALRQTAARDSYRAASGGNRGFPPVAALQAIDFHSVLADDLLVKADRMSMAWSLEVRCPYLDHGLIETFLPGPDRWKLRWGHRKALLRAVARRYLPREVVRRKKQGFMIPLDSLLRGDLSDFLGDMTSPDRLEREGILDPAGVASLLARWRTEPALAKTVWKVLCFETWLDTHANAATTAEFSAAGF